MSFCPCCYGSNVTTGGCSKCISRTWCSCGTLIMCSCGMVSPVHDCPNTLTATITVTLNSLPPPELSHGST